MEFPGRHFLGKVGSGTAEAMDEAGWTLLAEVDVDNASGVLRPGAYAEVHLKLPAAAPAMILPANALLFRNRKGCGLAWSATATRLNWFGLFPAKNYGNEIEVVSGIAETDNVIP